MYSHFILPHLPATKSYVEHDNVNDHRAAANDIVFKSRAARGSVCIVLLSDEMPLLFVFFGCNLGVSVPSE